MKQATFITGLSCVGFAVGLAAFIGSRLSEQAIALMAGALFGLERGPGGLELLDEGGDVGGVRFPEQRHGAGAAALTRVPARS